MITYSDINKIQDRLADEKSKDVFNMRFAYALNKADIFDFYDLIRDEKYVLYGSFYKWIAEQSYRDKLIIFGAGRIGKYTADIILNNPIDIEIAGFADSNTTGSSEYKGIKIMPFDQLCGMRERCKVVIASGVYRFQMLEQLLRNGFELSQIWFPPFTCLRGFIEKQYFDYFEPFFGGREVFIDGGAYDGMTTVDFFNWIGNGNGMSYLFEANFKNNAIIEEVLKKNQINNYKIITKGLYNKDAFLYFSAQDGAGAQLSEVGEKVQVTSIDNVFQKIDDKVTFIKMDIEGAEGMALEGAKGIIKRDSPRMAISIYHKPNDFVDIPTQILEIHHDYKFAFRQYCTLGDETILYAWRE